VRAAGQLDELLVDAAAVEVAAADDQQRALRRPVFGRFGRRQLLRGQGHVEGCVRQRRRDDEADRGDEQARATDQSAHFSYLTYFQLRILPSDIHCTAVSRRLSRVASVLASVTHAMYSRCAEGLKLANVACAFL